MKVNRKSISKGDIQNSARTHFPRCARLSSPVSAPTNQGGKLVLEKRCRSLATSRNDSTNSLPLADDLLSLPSSIKPTNVEQDNSEAQPLPRDIVLKNLRRMAKIRREFLQLQKVLIKQQNAYIEMYAQMRDLEVKAGVEPGEAVGDIRLLSVKGWPAHDLMLLVHDDVNISELTDINSEIGKSVLQEMKNRLSEIPEKILSMGAELMARRLYILECLLARQRPDRQHVNSTDFKAKISELDAETETLHNKVVETANQMESEITHSLNVAKMAWLDRDMLMKKNERLQKEVTILHTKSAPQEACGPENKKAEGKTISQLTAELEDERSARDSLKHVVASAAGMLQTARVRIGMLERQLKDTRTQLETTKRKHKEYEMLHRHRETSYDARSKKMLEVSKNGEVTIEMLSLQRDALELRVKELHDQMKTLEQDVEARKLEQKSRLEALQARIAEQDKEKKKMEMRITELETQLKVMEKDRDSLREKADTLYKINNEKYLDYLPSKESQPSNADIDLYMDLQRTTHKLQEVSEELRRSREDKDNLLASLSRIAQEGPENKMATELLNRELKIYNLQLVIEELRKNMQNMEEKMSQKESQLSSLQIEVGRLRNYDCYSKDIPTPDHALEVMELSTQVAMLTRERAALVSEVASRALMLERYERCTDLFAQVTRVRREIAAKIEGRSEHDLLRGTLFDANLSSSLMTLCQEASSTWTDLHEDRQSLMRLQSLVVAQNLQLEREAHVRNQLEMRRAKLERIILAQRKSNQQILCEEDLSI